MKDEINLDYETRSEVNLITAGLDLYVNHPSTTVLMAAWSINDGPIQQWDATYTKSPPAELREALASPDVDNWAFNAQFERRVTDKILKIPTAYEKWRCSMCLAYMMGFVGTLGDIGKAMGLSAVKTDGKDLIRKFSSPQRVTKNQPNRWLDAFTNPVEWDKFLSYNRNDVSAELAIKQALRKFPVLDREWRIYALDQMINDYGMFIDETLARQALALAERYKPLVVQRMRDVCQLSNPNSTAQLLPWLQDRGYPFADLKSDTVKKAIREQSDTEISDEAVAVLKLRQSASKTSLSKYGTMLKSRGNDGAFRYTLQYYGAQRTGRFAGRRLQTHNLPRTPKLLEDVFWMEQANDLIKQGDLEGLEILVGDPMVALVGCIRSAIIARPGHILRVADLSSIESVVIGWFTGCKWILNTLAENKDLYRSFAAFWLNLPYDETKPHRSKAKPATLGCGYRLGGGDIITEGPMAGKKTGLWGYAENMGVQLTKAESHGSVQAFRKLCPEIVKSWDQLEIAAKKAVKQQTSVKCGYVTFEYRAPFLCIVLPSGRRLYYYKPRVMKQMVKFGNESYEREQLTYMGKPQNKKGWVRLTTHGGKLIENLVQAIARDILVYGLMRAHKDGFKIPLHVHDEIVTEAEIGDEYHTVERLIGHMTAPISWAPGLPLGAAGWEGPFYRKD